MKTRIIFLACFSAMLFTSLTMQGQVTFGVKAGMNLETRSELGQLWNNDEIRPGFLVGGTVAYSFNNTLSLQTELNYIQKGEKTNLLLNGVDSDIQKEFNYITVPLLIKATFNDELGLTNNWNLYGYTGPYYGYLISANYKVKAAGETTDDDITDDSVKSDWGMVFGGGISRQLKNGTALFSELRYDMGLGEIDNNNSDLRNKSISLCLGFSF